MSGIMDEFKSKFKTEELLIYETDHWIWSLRLVQATLGAGVLSLKRECPVLIELNQNEFSDLDNIIKVIEKALKETFDYDIMNYIMLMMIDKQVHYHVIPRYERTIDFCGLTWKDSGWPGMPNLAGEEMELRTLDEILSAIKENLTV